MPAISPICRCWRCFPSSSSPRPSLGCSGGRRTRRWPSRRSSGGCRPTSATCSPVRSTRCSRAVRRAAVVRRARRPVDRGQLHRDDPRHSAPGLWRQIFGQLLAVPAGGDGHHPRRGRPAVRPPSRVTSSCRRRISSWCRSCPFRKGWRRELGFYRIVPAVTLFATFYIIFLALTPARYRTIECRKWPGALIVTLWWLLTVELLP